MTLRINEETTAYHEVERAQAVDFIGVNVAKLGVLDDGVLVNSLVDARSHGLHFSGKVGVSDLGHDDSAGSEVASKHHVGRDEVLVDGGIIRGAEEAADEANVTLDWVSGALVGHNLGSSVGITEPSVGRLVDRTVFSVSSLHHALGHVHDGLDSLAPLELAEEFVIASGLKVVPRKLKES